MRLSNWVTFYMIFKLRRVLSEGYANSTADSTKCPETGSKCAIINRVVGGDVVPCETSYPSVVHLRSTGCSAIILNEHWLMTAAHCEVKVRAKVLAGNPFKCESATYEQKKHVISVFNHEEFGGYDTMQNDIALLQVNSSFEFTPAVQPAKLISKDFKYPNPDEYVATVVGWGLTKEGVTSSESKVLQHADVPLVSADECTTAIVRLWLEKHAGMRCFGDYRNGGKDACQGDSGGPLYGTESGKSPGKVNWREHLVVGIVSFGKGCAQPLNPGVYTCVKHYVEWIERTMAENPWPIFQSSAPKKIRICVHFSVGFLAIPLAFQWIWS